MDSVFVNKNNRKYYLLNYIFILGIILLFLNDHFFKWQFSNWVTGKLSDFIGLLIFPFFLTFLFPKMKKTNVLFTGAFFIFWKSPFSQGFIDFYNSITFIEITRVVDYSDYITLLVLPFSYIFLRDVSFLNKFRIRNIRIHPTLVLFPSIIVFMATSPPYWHDFIHSEGNIKFFKHRINIGKSQQEILDEMETMKIPVAIDTTFYSRNPKILNFYVVDKLILDKDTIRDLRFSMVSFKENRTRLYLNAMTISKNVEDAEVKKELRKYYKKLLRRYFKENVKK